MPSNAHFLFIIYPQKHQLPDEEKFKMATYELIEDVIEIINQYTTIHKINIVEDENIDANISGMKKAFTLLIRRAIAMF